MESARRAKTEIKIHTKNVYNHFICQKETETAKKNHACQNLLGTCYIKTDVIFIRLFS